MCAGLRASTSRRSLRLWRDLPPRRTRCPGCSGSRGHQVCSRAASSNNAMASGSLRWCAFAIANAVATVGPPAEFDATLQRAFDGCQSARCNASGGCKCNRGTEPGTCTLTKAARKCGRRKTAPTGVFLDALRGRSLQMALHKKRDSVCQIKSGSRPGPPSTRRRPRQ